MVRQAHTYLAGAVSATALVSAAVVAFVLLVSLQALKDWPLAALGGDDDAALSPARPAGSGGGASAGAGSPGAAQAGAASRGGGRVGAGGRDGNAAPGAAPGEAPAGDAPAS